MGLRRQLRRAGLLLVVAAGLSFLTAASATAAPTIPGFPDCKDAPAAQLPGDGLTGFLDPAPNPTPKPADPFVQKPTTSVYEQYGYAGLTWHTYDLGCGGDVRDMGAATDTMIGNSLLSMANWGVAATNGLHNTIAHPERYMAPLDDVTNTVSARIKDTIWSPWGGAALLGVVVLLLWYSSAGRLSSVTRAAAWGLLVLAVMSAVAQYPSRVSAFFDQSVTGTISHVNAATAGLTSLPATSDPARAQGSLLVDRLLYDSWLRGELGSSDSPAAKRWGPALFRASAFTWSEAQAARDPAVAKQLADEKANAWKDTASQIQDQDPNAYVALQGKAGNRTGVGMMALLSVAFTSLFRVVADLFMFAGLVMLRFLVMLFPAVAVLGVMAPMSAIVRRVANMAGASVVNVVSFAAGAAVHTTVISALLARSQEGGMNVLILALCLITTVVAFVLLFPLLSLTNIVGLSAGGRGMHTLRRAGRLATKYGVTKKAVEDGEQDAHRRSGTNTGDAASDPADPSTTAGAGRGLLRHRLGYLPQESFGRPEPRLAPAAATAGHGASRTAVATTVLAATSYTPETRTTPSYAGRHASADTPKTTLEASPSPLRGSPSGSSPLYVARSSDEVLEGVVLDSYEADSFAGHPAHDSETVIRSDGIGPRLFDPATKSSARVDREGNFLGEAGEP